MGLPAEDMQVIKTGEDQFYISTRTNTFVRVEDLRGSLLASCEQALSAGRVLRLAAAAGVAEAAAVVAVLDTVAAFSDAEAAATFMAALRATAPE